MSNLLKDCVFIYCTCDKYDDLWQAYFKLINKYWNDIPMEILINTESKKFQLDEPCNININTTSSDKNISWSQRLLNILNNRKEKYVFLVIDDLFLKSKVSNEHFENMLSILDSDKTLASIQLSGCRRQSWEPETSQIIEKEVNGNKYIFKNIVRTKTETFPTLWKKDVLTKWIRPWESIWGFEGYGIKRTEHGRNKENVLRLMEPNIFDFLWVDECSPVINGQWFDSKEIDNFFEANNIKIDFDKRGRISYEEYMTHYISLFEHFKKYPLHEGIRRAINYVRSVYLS